MSDINKLKQTVIFHERIEPLLEYYEDDPEAFGRIMLSLFKYSVSGKPRESVGTDLTDKRERCDLKLLLNMIDQGRESSRRYQVNQIIKSNLRYAQDELDMRKRLELAGLAEAEIQLGVDKYRSKQNQDAGLTSDGQFPAGTSWDTVNKLRGY